MSISLLDQIVITDNNREAFQMIMDVYTNDDTPNAFIEGPKGSGKSTIARARAKERDLTSTKKASCAHPLEIATMIQAGINEDYLTSLGEVDVLFIDGIESALDEDADSNLNILNFLVKFRKSAGKPTILISDIPFSEIPASEFKNTVSDFKQIHVDPLDNAGVLTYVDVLEKAERKNDDAPTLAPDAKALLANEFVQDLSTLAHTIKFFINNADIEDGHEITADEVDATIHK